MTKLKTLKDLKTDSADLFCEAVSYEELKAVAIKWVKKDIKDWNKGGLFQSEIIKRWKERLNITEKDLMTNDEINAQENGEIGNN